MYIDHLDTSDTSPIFGIASRNLFLFVDRLQWTFQAAPSATGAFHPQVALENAYHYSPGDWWADWGSGEFENVEEVSLDQLEAVVTCRPSGHRVKD